MYFERGGYDPNASSEAQARLATFSGATSISSNQYFGREEENPEDGEDEYGYSRGGSGGVMDGDFSELESTAKEYYQRFMANPDVQSGIESFRAGAMKVSWHVPVALRSVCLGSPACLLTPLPSYSTHTTRLNSRAPNQLAQLLEEAARNGG